MKDKKGISPRDSNGQHHGYQEWYINNDKLELRCIMKHGEEIKYEEWHNWSETNYYIR